MKNFLRWKNEKISNRRNGREKNMRFLDVFSGIGGFRMGLENSGHTCIGHIERDTYALKSYKAIYNIKEDEYEGKDITEIEDFTELRGKFELLTGGFPCQSFSIAGRRKGFDDIRGTMFFYLAKILEQAKPPFFLFENVKGLLSHDKGKTFETILNTLDALGYNTQWQLLNSKDFGVPQNRERVYITGYLREGSGREIFPLKRASRKDYRNEYATTVPTRYRGNGGETYVRSEPKILKIGGGTTQGNRVYSTKGLSCTLSANGGGRGAKTGLYAIPILTPDRVKKRQNGRRYKTDGEPMFTLTAQDRHGVIIGNNRRYFRIRRLTPKECWRLQGFPDWAFEKAKEVGTSDAQLYKQAGNAVTVNVIQAIGQELKEMEREVEE